MSKIVLTVQPVNSPDANVLKQLRGLLRQPLGNILRALREGGPLLEVKLFYNDHEEVADQLVAVCEVIHQAGITLHIFELDERETWQNQATHETGRISLETLKNILENF